MCASAYHAVVNVEFMCVCVSRGAPTARICVFLFSDPIAPPNPGNIYIYIYEHIVGA